MKAKSAGRQSKSDEIYRQLKDAIIRGELRPGDRIVESRVAKENGVSQASVREAIGRLKDETLVITARHRGTFVSSLSVEDVDDLYALREVLDDFALKWALRNMADTHLERVQELYEEIERTGYEDDLSGFVEADMKFHSYIYEMAKHEFLNHVWLLMHSKFEQAWYLLNRMHYSHLSEPALRHKPIADALSRRDFDAAREANRAHLQHVRNQLKQFH